MLQLQHRFRDSVQPAAGSSRLAGGPTTALTLSKMMLNDAYELSFEQAIEEETRSAAVNSSAQGGRAAIEGALRKDSRATTPSA